MSDPAEAVRRLLRDGAASPAWTARELEIYLLEQIGSAARLEPDAGRRAEIAAALEPVFGQSIVSARDYERVLGPPLSRIPLAASGEFASSHRCAWQLASVPAAKFCVNATPLGLAWGVGFYEGGFGEPADCIEPWRWTEDQVRRVASHFEVVDDWDERRAARVTVGGAELEASFGYGLLLSWISAAEPL